MFLRIPFTAILLAAAAVNCNRIIGENDFHESNKSVPGNVTNLVGGLALYHVNSSFGSGPMVYGNISTIADEDGKNVALAKGNFTSFGLVDESPINRELGLNNSSVIVGTVANLEIKGNENISNDTLTLSSVDHLISHSQGQIMRGRKMQITQHTRHGTQTQSNKDTKRRLSKTHHREYTDQNDPIPMTRKEREMAIAVLRAKMEKIEHDIPRLNLALHLLDKIYDKNQKKKRDQVKAPPLLALLTLADNILNNSNDQSDPFDYGTNEVELVINKVENTDGKFFDRKSNQTF